MNTSEAFSKIKLVIDTFQFLVQLETLADTLAIRKIVSDKDTIPLVHSAKGNC